MNRRQFTLSIASLGLAPALPAMADPKMAPPYTPYMYGLGAHFARTTGLCSAEMLGRKLALSPPAAQAMQSQLLRQGVITAPSVTGVAVAKQPYMAAIRFKTVAGTAQNLPRRLARTLTDSAQAEDPDTPENNPNQSS